MAKDLGFIQAIFSGAAPPTNTQMLWYDTNVNLHKYYDTGTTTWVPLAGGASSWATVLAAGAETLGTSPIISPGDQILFEQGGFRIALEIGVLTANRVVQFQDKDGTIALLSDIASAGDLAAVLALGNTTGGNDISIDSGDLITASSGTAYIDMREGGIDGRILMFSSTRNRIFSATESIIGAGTIVQLLVTGGPTTAQTATGFGLNTGSPESKFHVSVASGAPAIGSAEVSKVKGGGLEVHTGISGLTTYTQSYNGPLTFNPDRNETVSVASRTYDPSILPNVYLNIGDPTLIDDTFIGITSQFGSASGIKLFTTASTEQMFIGMNSSGKGILRNLRLNGLIDIFVNNGGVDTAVARFNGLQAGVDLLGTLNVNPATFFSPIPHPGVGLIPSSLTDKRLATVLDYSTAGIFTGIANPYEGRLFMINNKNAAALTLEHGNFAAGINAFVFPGATDITLNQNEGVILMYAQSAWRLVART